MTLTTYNPHLGKYPACRANLVAYWWQHFKHLIFLYIFRNKLLQYITYLSLRQWATEAFCSRFVRHVLRVKRGFLLSFWECMSWVPWLPWQLVSFGHCLLIPLIIHFWHCLSYGSGTNVVCTIIILESDWTKNLRSWLMLSEAAWNSDVFESNRISQCQWRGIFPTSSDEFCLIMEVFFTHISEKICTNWSLCKGWILWMYM